MVDEEERPLLLEQQHTSDHFADGGQFSKFESPE